MLNVSHHHDSSASPGPIVPTENAIGFNLQQIAELDPAKAQARAPEPRSLWAVSRTASRRCGFFANRGLVDATLTHARAVAAATPSERGQITRGELSIAQLRNARRIHRHRDCPHLAQCLASASPEVRAAAVTAIGVHPDLVRVRS